jgi:hypothetical protein
MFNFSFSEWTVSKFTPEHLISIGDSLGDNASAPNNWHEIRITLPARHDMGVDMVGDTGTGNSTHVCPEIKSGRIERFLQNLNAPFNNFYMFGCFFFCQVIEPRNVPIRRYQ